MKEEMIKLKRIKKTTFVRASKMQEFITALNHKQIFEIDEPLFAYKEINIKVNNRLKESMPYFINTYHFVDNAGLYFVVGFENKDDLLILDELIKSLGYTGIGGKHSSGYGKYEFADERIIAYDEHDGVYDDDMALIKSLNNVKGRFQLNIAPISPITKDVTAMDLGSICPNTKAVKNRTIRTKIIFFIFFLPFRHLFQAVNFIKSRAL